MTHIMHDLETWGTQPGSHLRSIGAVVFDPLTGTMGNTFYCNIAEERSYGLLKDPETVAWWKHPERAEAAKVFAEKPLDLRVALTRYIVWLRGQADHPHDIRLWGHGPCFDNILIDCAIAAVGLESPLHYRAPRDTRTIFEAAGIDLKQRPFVGIEHHALDDAKFQALAVIDAWRIVTGKRRDDLLEANNREVDRRRYAEGQVCALHFAATKLREAQRAYMADRGNETLGAAVGVAAAALDLVLNHTTLPEKCCHG